MTESTDLVVQHREAASAALAAGDTAAANDAYQRELQARAGTPAPATGSPAAPSLPAVPALAPEHVDAAFEMMEWWDEGQPVNRSAELRQRWGADAGANIAIARSFAAQHPDIAAVIDRNGLGDHPAIIEAVAMLGRRVAVGELRPATAQTAPQHRTAPAAPVDRVTLDDDLSGIRERIRRAQAEGHTALANRLYQAEQAAIAARGGSRPVVGSGGRYA